MSSEFSNLESALRLLGQQAGLSISEKRAIRDTLFLKIGSQTLRPTPYALSPRFAWLVSVPVAIFALFLSLATGVVAQQAMPGDALFVLKRAVESLQLYVTKDPLRIASVKLQIADDRVRGLQVATSPEDLARVLDSTKVALADANQAVSSLPKEMADNLVTRLEGLLEQQNSILDRLSKTAPTEEIKTKIVAIREEIKKSTGSGEQEASSGGQTVASTPAEEPVLSVMPDLTKPGFVSLIGSLGTAYGQPAIILPGSDLQYFKLIAPLPESELIALVGSSISVCGQLDPINKILVVSYL